MASDDNEEEENHSGSEEEEEDGPVESGPSKDDDIEDEVEEDDQDDDDDDEEDSSAADDDDDDDEDDGSDSDEDEDQDGAAGGGGSSNGISDYERLRLERIKRNQERLKQLGLQAQDGHGLLGPKPKKSRKKKRRISSSNEPIEQRERLSRRSKTMEVDYSGDLNLRAMMGAEKEATRQARLEKKRNAKPRKDKSHDTRVPLFIYQEFQRIRSTRKEALKQAKRHIRLATREAKYWEQQVSFITNKEESKFRREKLLRQQQVERDLLNGKTQNELLQELDMRTPELQAIVQKYDTQQMSVEEQERQQQLAIEEWNKKQGLDRKLQMIDALESFPRSMNDAISTLNSLLVSRSPKDPPPPRRSKRSAEEEEEELASKKKKRAKTKAVASSPTEQEVDAWSNLTASMAAAAAQDATKTTITAASADDMADDATAASNVTRKKRPKDARNVGGWVSPIFSQQLDRSWLERTKPMKRINVVPPAAVPKGTAMPVFDFNSYAPQPGDVILFYPSAYRDFLEVHPDTLGSRMRNLLRVPLWIRARRQMGRLKQGTGSDEDEKVWFTEEWISSLTGKKGDEYGGSTMDTGWTVPTLGDYPIICQVTRTHTEFPPDPYSKEKSISKSGKETTITWAQPSAAKLTSSKLKSDRPQIRLAITLKALSKVVPPNFDKESPLFSSPMAVGRNSHHISDEVFAGSYADLALPPNFTVISSPVSAPLEPFMIPFCYGYTLYHSLSVGESVYIRRAENDEYHKDDSKTKRAGKSPLIQGKGRVLEFSSAREGEPTPDMLPPPNNFVDMSDINPTLGDPFYGVGDYGDPLGNDPFGLQDALGPDGLGDVQDALGASGHGGDATEWHQPHAQRKVVTRSFRLEDHASNLKGLVANLTTNGVTLPEVLGEALTAEEDKASIPLREAGIIFDFLAMIQKDLKSKNANGELSAQSPKMSLMDLIQSSLPMRHGVTVSLDANRRNSHRTSPWHLVPFHPTEYVRNIQDAFVSSLDNATREKAVMGLEDLVENHKPNSQIFQHMITEEAAPGYYCAVPVAMFFDRIFARLKANSQGKCYYSSTDSIIMDLTAISENCMLFNSPDSDLVAICNAMTLDCKKFVADLSKTSGGGIPKQKSNTATIKQRSTISIPDDLNAPYKNKIHREWIQRVTPDEANRWLPQCGDKILYSRSRHKDFISGHVNSLADIQCLLPGVKSSPPSNDGGTIAPADLETTTMSHWLKGTVVSVRTTFPLAPTGEAQDSFDQPAIILAVELQLNYSWCKDTIVVFWRPCYLSKARENDGDKCKMCNLPPESFLQLEEKASKRQKVLESGLVSMEIPGTLDVDVTSSLKRCFDLLMRRSIAEIPPAYINPLEALSLAERNIAIHPGSRSLPSFEDFLLSSSSGRKQSNTRGVKQPEEFGAVTALTRCGFLPQWSPEFLHGVGQNDKHIPKHEVFMPHPTLCLELVRMRITFGYYRDAMAIVNDISESYVTAVLFILSGPATRKLNRLSIRRVTKFLASPRGSPKMPKLYYKKKKSIGGVESNPSIPEKAESGATEDFTPEEILLIGRITQLRSFHATAIVFATQAMQVERLFCLKVIPVPPPQNLPAIVPVEENKNYSEEQLEGIAKIRWVLKAIGRDPADYRIQFTRFASSKKYKLRISCGGQRIAENGELQAMADGVTYFQPSSVSARKADGHSFRVQIRCGDEIVGGERRPVANPLENTGWPMPLVGPQPIMMDNIRDNITLSFSQFEKDDSLSRALLGLPGRRFPCVRCQSKGSSTLQCRVRKGHSNLDFSIIEHFQGTSGVDSLFLPWRGHQEGSADNFEEEKIGMQELEDEKDAKVKDVEEEERKAEATREQRARRAKENLNKAKAALESAQYLSVQAYRLNELEAKLSDEFVRDYFPFDPEDNHYIFCIHCGTAGNLLLCEGCSNVSHPECAGLIGIPEGDWFCPRCVKEKGLTSAIQPSSESMASKAASEPTDSLAQVVTRPPVESTDQKEDQKKSEESVVPFVGSAEDRRPEANPTTTSSPESKNDAEGKPEPTSDDKVQTKKKVPLPQISDDDLETKQSELDELIEGLTCQHEDSKPKLKKQKEPPVEPQDDDNEDATKKRGRPRKNDVKSPKKAGRRRSQGGTGGDSIEALSAAARSFLESISITTGERFLAAGSSRLGADLVKWRKKEGMPPLKGSGNIATISGWKTIVRNAGAQEYLSDDSEEVTEIVPVHKPRGRSSIEKRETAAAKSPKPKGRKRQRSKSPAKLRKAPRSDNPIENLPAQGQNFCDYLKITDPEDFLAKRTSELAESLVNFRCKAKMPALAGSGPSAYVAMWKTQLRQDVAYFRSLEQQRASRSKSVKRGSKVQDMEEAATTEDSSVRKRMRRGGASPKKTDKAADDASTPAKPASKTKVRRSGAKKDEDLTFNVLKETEKLAAEEEEDEERGGETPGRRRRVKTNRYAP